MPRKTPKKAQEIRDRIKKFDDYWRFNRTQFHEWMDFVMGDMWKEDESKVFTRYNKMPLTVNKLGALTNFMLGEQLQNTPGIELAPEEDVPEQAVEIRQAIIRQIMSHKESEIAYQTGFEHSVIGGYGAYYLATQYTHEYSFDQEAIIGRIQDPTRCYWDMNAESINKEDGMFAGRRSRISREMLRGEWGEKLERSIPSSSYTEDTTLMSFNDDDSVTVIDDYERVYDTTKIYKLSNDQIVDQKKLDKLKRIEIDGKEIMVDEQGLPLEIIAERETPCYKVIHRKIAGDWELEKEEFPSQLLPIIFIDQKSYWDKNGKQICRPFFKDAKDAQRYLNYLATQSAYITKVTRYDQFLVSKANMKSPDTQAIWRDPATQQGGLVYDESPNGSIPQQLRPAELPQSLLMQYERCLKDIETSTGIYGTQLGQQGGEASGKAVDARTRQGSYNTYVCYNSINRAVRAGCVVLNQMIPVVYDTKRSMKLKMDDQMTKSVTINNPIDDYTDQRENDMTEGRFKIQLLPAPNSDGQKQEALESMNMVLTADKTGQILPMIIDLYVENLPLKNNIQLRNRLRTLVPPEIIEAGKTGQPPPPKQEAPPPEVMLKMKDQEIAQQGLQIQMMKIQSDAQMKQQELSMKQKDLEAKAQAEGLNIHMEWEKLQDEKLEAAARLQEAEMRYQAEMARIQGDVDISHAENISKLLMHAGEMHYQKEQPIKGESK